MQKKGDLLLPSMYEGSVVVSDLYHYSISTGLLGLNPASSSAWAQCLHFPVDFLTSVAYCSTKGITIVINLIVFPSGFSPLCCLYNLILDK